MMEKRIYIINKFDVITHPVLGEYYIPYLAGITHWDDSNNSSYWTAIYNHQTEEDPIPHQAIVTVYTDETDHAILEADPDITRLDDIL
jgi:hypothetical protein